jgi:hypothetical protein
VLLSSEFKDGKPRNQEGTYLIPLKRILLTQYIGAIMIGFIASQGLLRVITMITIGLVWGFLTPGEHSRNVFGVLAPPTVDWGTEVIGIVYIALHFAIAYALMWWLYREQPASEEPSDVPSGS